MKVKVNKPEPQPIPPTTYDIVGLTWDEALAIRLALLDGSVDLKRRKDGPNGRDELRRLHDEITAGI